MADLELAKAIPFVAGAYIGIWVISFGYLLFMGRNIARLHQELKVLSQVVQKKAEK